QPNVDATICSTTAAFPVIPSRAYQAHTPQSGLRLTGWASVRISPERCPIHQSICRSGSSILSKFIQGPRCRNWESPQKMQMTSRIISTNCGSYQQSIDMEPDQSMYRNQESDRLVSAFVGSEPLLPNGFSCWF